MSTYVCRTCLYVCNNEFFFKKLEKVKDILESCVPEIKNILVSNTILCEQCYQFLKCLRKFREKCLQSQNRLCSVNIDNIRDNADLAINNARWQLRSNLPYLPANQISESPCESQDFSSVPRSTRGSKRSAEIISVIDFASTNEMTSKLFKAKQATSMSNTLESTTDLTNIKNPTKTSNIKADYIPKTGAINVKHAHAMDLTVNSVNPEVNIASANLKRSKKKNVVAEKPSDELICVSDADVNDSNISVLDNGKHIFLGNSMKTKINKKARASIYSINFKPKSTNSILASADDNILHKSIPKNSQNDVITACDNASGKNTPEINDNLPPPEMPVLTSHDDSDLEIVEIDDEEGSGGKTVELKIRRKSVAPDTNADIVVSSNDSHNDDEGNNTDVNHNHHNEFEDMPVLTKVKEEAPDEQNPGFFNKKNADGHYVCRMCSKVYKTSKGLYNHTKDIHSKDLKFFHCGFCSFFTLWRTALRRHCQNYHGTPAKKTKNPLKKSNSAKDPLAIENILRRMNEKTPDIVKNNVAKKAVTTSPSIGKLDSTAILKCHLPDCYFHCFSRIILNQHLISRHKLSSNENQFSAGPSRLN